jgi:nitrogen fixation protein FixH
VAASITTLSLSRRHLRGAHVLIAIVAFFCVVIAVNAIMVYSAVSTYSGVVAAEPYRKGLHYNDRVLANERQQLLGWQDAFTVDRSGQIALTIRDVEGRSINGLDVQIIIGRPATNRHDTKVALIANAAGGYAAKVAPLQAGTWIVTVEARTSAADENPIFRARRRLWLAQ